MPPLLVWVRSVLLQAGRLSVNPSRVNPPSSDRHIRELQRRAALGDRDAQEQLTHAMQRTGETPAQIMRRAQVDDWIEFTLAVVGRDRSGQLRHSQKRHQWLVTEIIEKEDLPPRGGYQRVYGLENEWLDEDHEWTFASLTETRDGRLIYHVGPKASRRGTRVHWLQILRNDKDPLNEEDLLPRKNPLSELLVVVGNPGGAVCDPCATGAHAACHSDMAPGVCGCWCRGDTTRYEAGRVPVQPRRQRVWLQGRRNPSRHKWGVGDRVARKWNAKWGSMPPYYRSGVILELAESADNKGKKKPGYLVKWDGDPGIPYTWLQEELQEVRGRRNPDEDELDFDRAQAYYWWLADHHGGQGSEEYAQLSHLADVYRPGGLERGPNTEESRAIYDQLCDESRCRHRRLTRSPAAHLHHQRLRNPQRACTDCGQLAQQLIVLDLDEREAICPPCFWAAADAGDPRCCHCSTHADPNCAVHGGPRMNPPQCGRCGGRMRLDSSLGGWERYTCASCGLQGSQVADRGSGWLDLERLRRPPIMDDSPKPPRRRRRKNAPTPPKRTKKRLGARAKEVGTVDLGEVEEHFTPAQIEEAQFRYDMWHGEPADEAVVIRVDDGKPGVTRKLVVAQGVIPKSLYRVDWPNSTKGDAVWEHSYIEGKEPLRVLDPETNLMLELPTNPNAVADDFLREKGPGGDK